jgi:hypothetical protein
MMARFFLWLTRLWAAGVMIALVATVPAALAQTPPPPTARLQLAETVADSETNLAKKIQNPIGDLYSVPFQSNTNFGYGPHKGTREILSIQPVMPIHVNQDWNIITHTILPLIWNPPVQPAQTVPFGTGSFTFSAFLSPKIPTNGWLWGVGPVVQIPVSSSATLGSGVWGGGPTAVLVRMTGPWVAGALINNIWSLRGHDGPTGKSAGGSGYSVMTLQPVVNYNFGEG